MLYDLMLLETYYGSLESAQFYEDLSRNYGIPAIQKALNAGLIAAKKIKLRARYS